MLNLRIGLFSNTQRRSCLYLQRPDSILYPTRISASEDYRCEEIRGACLSSLQIVQKKNDFCFLPTASWIASCHRQLETRQNENETIVSRPWTSATERYNCYLEQHVIIHSSLSVVSEQALRRQGDSCYPKLGKQIKKRILKESHMNTDYKNLNKIRN